MKHVNQFHVFRLEENDRTSFRQPGGDYYAICLISNHTPGTGAQLHFHHPQAKQAAVSLSRKPAGYSCLFNASFLSDKMQGLLQSLPMFSKGANPVYFLNAAQDLLIRDVFEKMLEEVNNNYTFKYELLGNYLAEIIHQAMKILSSACR
jgi:hypothetical protein